MTDKATQGRRNRNRGRKFERTVAEYLGGELVPGSGMYASHKGDVTYKGLTVECKKTSALTTQRKWLAQGNADVVIQSNPREQVGKAIVCMSIDTFMRIMGGE